MSTKEAKTEAKQKLKKRSAAQIKGVLPNNKEKKVATGSFQRSVQVGDKIRRLLKERICRGTHFLNLTFSRINNRLQKKEIDQEKVGQVRL